MSRIALVSLRAYGSLNDFLPRAQRYKRVALQIEAGTALKDAIERRNIVHPEVDLALVGGRVVGLDHGLSDGDDIAVYPRFERLVPDGRLLPSPQSPARFLLDVHLGRLAAYLRAAGFDTAWSNQASDAELAQQSSHEDRTLLTRDIGLLKRSLVQRGYWVRSTEPRWQLVEVLARHAILPIGVSFSRCIRCNALLEPVSKQSIEHLLLPGTQRRHQRFWRCVGCQQVFWKGSHHARLVALLTWAEGQALGGGQA